METSIDLLLSWSAQKGLNDKAPLCKIVLLRSLKSDFEVETGNSKGQNMQSWELCVKIDLIAIACFYHLKKPFAIHVADNCVGFTRLHSMETKGQVESSSLWALYWL